MPSRQTPAKKPQRKRQFTNIYPRWVKSEERWKWRPALRIRGDLVWGRSCDTQKSAYTAYLRMREKAQVIDITNGMTLQAAFDETVERLRDNGGSEHTIKGYEARFKRWKDFLNADASVAEITPSDIRHLIRQRRKIHKVGNNTIRWDLAVLHRVFVVAGIPQDQNPARKEVIERPEEKQPDRPVFSMQKVAEMEQTIRTSGKPGASFHADVVVFLAITGIRAFEFSRLRSGDVDFDTEHGGGVLKVQGKRSGVRRVAFCRADEDLIKRMLERAEDGPILTPGGLATVMKRWASTLSEPGLNARALRRTFATDMADGADLRTIQTQLGHSQLTTTQRYLGERPELARAAAERRHLRLHGE